MRQACIIAAPGIIALEKMISRLEEDHKNARALAEGLTETTGVEVELENVQTNIVYFGVHNLGITSEEFVSKLKKNGVLALTHDKNEVRMVTHLGIEKVHIDRTLKAVEDIARKL